MKLVSTISRCLLGLMFTVFGFNGFLRFIPQPPPANPVVMQFMTAVTVSHYIALVFLVQILGGILLLTGRYMPLAIAILAPGIVNILNYHVTMDPGSIGPGVFATVLWGILFVRYRSSFAGVFDVQPMQEESQTA